MKYITSILVLSALFSCSFAVNPSIKSRLGKNLAQIEISAEAESTFQQFNQTDCVLTPLPALVLNCPCNVTVPSPVVQGSSSVQAYNQQSQVQTSQSTQQIPNNAQVTNCISNCCSCNIGQEQAVSQAAQSRHFAISGSIDIEESICYKEASQEQENSLGESQKAQSCSTAYQSAGSGSPPPTQCLEVSITNPNQGQAQTTQAPSNNQQITADCEDFF